MDQSHIEPRHIVYILYVINVTQLADLAGLVTTYNVPNYMYMYDVKLWPTFELQVSEDKWLQIETEKI